MSLVDLKSFGMKYNTISSSGVSVEGNKKSTFTSYTDEDEDVASKVIKTKML